MALSNSIRHSLLPLSSLSPSLSLFSRSLSSSSPMNKTGVVMMNLGGPATLDAVHPFLLRLFSDKDLIPLPFQKYLAPMIAKRRTPKIQDQYAAIGGGSPILKWTELQGKLMCEALDKSSPKTAPHKPYVAMRYADPLTKDMVNQLKKDGVTRAVAFSQYPQYSCSTTGSSLNELYRVLKEEDKEGSISWSVIDRWFYHPTLIKAFCSVITEKLMEFDEKERDDVTILFSAHSLPMDIVDRGDPYPTEVSSTVNEVMKMLNWSNPYRLVWQSKVGPKPWLGPNTFSAMEGLNKNGRKNVILVPIAFTSDHIETLFELDLEYAHDAEELGMTVKRARAFNDDPLFIDSLSSVVYEHLHPSSSSSSSSSSCPSHPQLALRCPMCINETCGKMRNFFVKS